MLWNGTKPDSSLWRSDGVDWTVQEPVTVERDACGVPVAWKILSQGGNPLVRNGIAGELLLEEEDLAAIMAYFQTKGELIPIDSRHYLHRLAMARHLDEAEIVRLLPEQIAAMGFARLERRGSDLWVRVEKWNPTAYELLKEGIFKYYSPVLRGLTKPPLRLTSVALENEPGINHLDSLAAAAESREQQKGGFMDPAIVGALAELLRADELALGADGVDAGKLAERIGEKSRLIAEIRNALGLSPEVSDAEIAAALHSALAKAGGYDALKAELDAIRTEQEVTRRDALIDQGLAEGKLTCDSAENWARKQDSAALAAYLEYAPVAVPLQRIVTGEESRLAAQNDAAPLSSDDRKAIRFFGFTEEAYKTARKGK